MAGRNKIKVNWQLKSNARSITYCPEQGQPKASSMIHRLPSRQIEKFLSLEIAYRPKRSQLQVNG